MARWSYSQDPITTACFPSMKDKGSGSEKEKRAQFAQRTRVTPETGGALEDPYRGNGLEVSYWGRRCGGCGCGACCIGHPGREVYGPALGALRSHLHKGTTVGRAQQAVH